MTWLIAIGLIWLAWRYWWPARKQVRPTEEQRARRILGVGPNADESAIRAAHRRLLSEEHPDRGGSLAATTEINAARDLLLREGRRGG